MTIQEIENLSFAELKEQQDELLGFLKSAPPEEVAKRYLQARTDAKMRDEKLAEQAETLSALKDGLLAAKQERTLLLEKTAEEVKSLRNENKLLAEQSAKDIGLASSTTQKMQVASDQRIQVLCDQLANQESLVAAALIREEEIATVWANQDAARAEQILALEGRCARLALEASKYGTAVSSSLKLLLDATNSTNLDRANKGQ